MDMQTASIARRSVALLAAAITNKRTEGKADVQPSLIISDAKEFLAFLETGR